MDEQNIKQHFRPEEGHFIDQVNDWITIAQEQYRPVLTPFLNPRECFIAETIVNRNDNVKLGLNGGWIHAEMKRALIYPAYFSPAQDDFELQALEIDYPTKFSELHHRQIMGTLIGEGLERNAFGDILTDGQRWQILVSKPMAMYLQENVNHIGKIKIKWLQLDLPEILRPENDWEELITTVTSLRLDALISAGFNYSRNRAKQLIEHGQVRLNWSEVDRPDYQLVIHDIISVRHAGRLRVDMVNGKTKKAKERVTLSIIKA